MKLCEADVFDGECTAEECRAAAEALEPIVSELTVPAAEPSADSAPRGLAALVPSMAVVFLTYLVIGIAMPVLPLHVHQGLGLSAFVVGLVSGSQFAAALLTRPWAGYLVDRRGARPAVTLGLLIAAGSGLFYLLSLRFASLPETSVAIVLGGRALLGAAESLIITGALTAGMARLGPQSTGKVMSWVGTALYAALAAGAPAGAALYAAYGFTAVALASALVPLGALPLVALFCPARPHQGEQPHLPLKTVLAAVWQPGLGLAISGVGFAAVTTFVALLFAEHGWDTAWAAFTALSGAFVAGRLLFGHLPDRVGGARIALVCILIEAAGLALIWRAPSYALALGGVALTGLGYSLVYPGFGVEAIRRVPAQSRGLAMGAYTAFLDLSLGLSGPLLGLVAGWGGLGAVFLVSALVVLGSAAVAARLLRVKGAAGTAGKTAEATWPMDGRVWNGSGSRSGTPGSRARA